MFKRSIPFVLRSGGGSLATSMNSKPISGGLVVAHHQLRHHACGHGHHRTFCDEKIEDCCMGEGGANSTSKRSKAPDHCPTFYSQPGEIEEHVQGENLQACKNVLMFGAASNLTYSFLKIYFGTEGGSVAMLADGVHAFVDFGADTISYFSVHVTHRKYPRSRFPFGLGRFETIGSLIIATMLMSGGTALFLSASERLESSYARLIETEEERDARHNKENEGSTCRVKGCNHTHNERGGILGFLTMFACDHGDEDSLVVVDHETGQTKLLWSMIAVSVSCLVLKQVLFRWARSVGTKAGSRIVVANAYHHRADSWTSGIALIGIMGQTFGIPFLDGLCGAFVSALIAKTGFQLFRNSMLEIFDFQSNDVRSLGERIRCDLEAEGIQNAINVFAVRHGHMYALNATVLVHGSASGDEPFSPSHIHRTQEAVRSLAKDTHKVALSALSVTTINVTDITANKGKMHFEPVTAQAMLEVLRAEGVDPAHSTNDTSASEATGESSEEAKEIKRKYPNHAQEEGVEPTSNNNKTSTESNIGENQEEDREPLSVNDTPKEQAKIASLMQRYAAAVDVLTSVQQFYGMSSVVLSEIVIDLRTNALYILRNPEQMGQQTTLSELYGLVDGDEEAPTNSADGVMYQALDLDTHMANGKKETPLSGRQHMLLQDLKSAAHALGLSCPQLK